MSKVDDRLDELLDIQGEIVQAEKNLPTVVLTTKTRVMITNTLGKSFTVS